MGRATRRTVLQGGAAIAATTLGLSRTWAQNLTDAEWQDWQTDWRRMEEIVTRRAWEVTPLKIDAPASEAEIDALGARFGLSVPPQLRQGLSRSRKVEFGWYIPNHLRPMEREQLPTSSSNRDAIWDIDHIAQYAMPNFLGWKQDLASRERSEAPNSPALWENQFAFNDLKNGDMLAIDMRQPDGPQPVRYFSHELEMIHGLALAPDFFSFITVMSKLGFAGTEWASYLPFGIDSNDNDRFYLSTETNGAKRWLAFLARDPALPVPDEPPPAIVESGPIERSLLQSARDKQLPGVVAALAAGARPDVIGNDQWRSDVAGYSEEYHTALCYAAKANSIQMMDRLVKSGASVNTRQLAMDMAAEWGSPETIKWLMAHGSRVNGWKYQRKWPLHFLVTDREASSFIDKPAYANWLRQNHSLDKADTSEWSRAYAADKLASWIDKETFLATLSALLEAGANPDAPWDNGITMLIWCKQAETARTLLKYGANITQMVNGETALHWWPSLEKAKLLIEQGADVNALSPKPSGDEKANTPFQEALRWGSTELRQLLVDSGADPRKRDGRGMSSVYYASTLEALHYVLGFGLDIRERNADDGTLLHSVISWSGLRPEAPDQLALFDYLLREGFDINDQNGSGNTPLHLAAERASRAVELQLLLDRGSDKSIRNKAGKRPVDLVAREETELKALLQ